jgi:hypothetical protein
MDLSPDGAILALGSQNAIHLRNLERGNTQFLRGGCCAIKYKTDAIFRVCDQKGVRVYNRNECVFQKEIPLCECAPPDPLRFIDDAVFSPVDNNILSCSSDRLHCNRVYICDWVAGSIICFFERWHAGCAYDFLPDGEHLIFAADHQSYEIRNVTCGGLAAAIRTSHVETLTLSTNASLVATCGTTTTLWNVFDRAWICATVMLLLEIDVGGYVVRDILNMLHATTGSMFAPFAGIADFFGSKKFRLIARVQQKMRLEQSNEQNLIN